MLRQPAPASRPRGDRPDRQLAVAWAAIALVALGWGVALWPGPPPPPAACPQPRVRPAPDGRGLVVACGPGAGAGAPLRGPARLLFGRPLDLARAPAGSLEVLPGIGPARAAAIVRERDRHAFERVADLQRVHGIGPRTVAGLAGWVEVTHPTDGGRAGPLPAR